MAPGGEEAFRGYTLPAVGYGTYRFRSILVVQTQRLGDVVCLAPLLSSLRRRFPRARLGALLHHPHQELLIGNPEVDEVLVYDRHTTHRSLASRVRLIGEIHQREYDWALVIHAASTVGFALWQSGIPWRTCVWRYGDRLKPHWARMYHQHVRQDRLDGTRHEIDYNLDVLRELGIPPETGAPRVRVLREEQAAADELLAQRGYGGGPLAVVHPGHGGGRQGWPAGEYGRVARGLVERGYQVAVSGGGRERELVEAVAAAAGVPVLALAGGMSLRCFMGVLARASLFVSVSTGPMHLASALGVPAVTLYGPSDLRVESTRFCPYGSPARPVFSTVPCPCTGSHTCKDPVCMTGLTPAAVLEAADALRQRQEDAPPESVT